MRRLLAMLVFTCLLTGITVTTLATEEAIPSQAVPASLEEATTVDEVQAYVEHVFAESRKNMKTEEDEQRFLTTYSPVGIEGGRKIIALSTDDESLENGYGILLTALNWSIKEHPENEKEYIAVVEELKKLDKFPELIVASRFVTFYRELGRFDPTTGTLEDFNKFKEEAKQLLLVKGSNYPATGPTKVILEVANKMGLAKNDPAFLDTVRDEIVRFAEEQRGVAQEELDLALRGYCRRLDGMPFELWGKTVDGKDFSWDDYKGKVVLIDFTASWCGPCRAEMPNLVEMYQTYHDQGLEVISVGYEDTTENLKKMIEEDGIKFPVISEELSQEDERGIPSTHFGIHGIPEIFLVGKDGKIAATSLRGGRLRTQVAKQFETKDAMKTFHDFTVKDINGDDFPLSQFKGKKVLVVNVASKCGLTPQYEELQELYTKYGKGNFTIIAFPANNYGQQEPGTNFEIREFCTKNYGVTFPVMAKISVTGDDMHPLYHWLTKKSLNGKQDVQMEWNFQKFLIDENGNWVDFVAPREKPNGEKIIQWIE